MSSTFDFIHYERLINVADYFCNSEHNLCNLAVFVKMQAAMFFIFYYYCRLNLYNYFQLLIQVHNEIITCCRPHIISSG